MTTMNKYEDMSAITALKYAGQRNLLLPDIQREYVWKPEEVEELFESIVNDYPIGFCIFWKTNKRQINDQKPNLYYFLRDYEQEKSKNEKAPEIITEENDYYIVLDGQQRITSLNIALYGSYTVYKGGRGHSWYNPKSWIKKELYYNLDYYEPADDEEENPLKRFRFLGEKDAGNGNYYKVKHMLQYEHDDFIEYMINNNFSKKARSDLAKLHHRLFDPSDNGLIHYYCITEESYDKALNIFVKVNSTGRKLSKSDLLFSTLIDGWKTGRESIDSILEIMNSKGDKFGFTRDYLMKLCLVLVDANANLKIDSFTQDKIKDIRNNWDKIATTLDKLSDLLVNLGLGKDTLTSYNATMPIAYYLYHGGSISTGNDKKEVRKFLYVTMAKQLFGVASNSALNATRNALKDINCRKTPFSLSLFSNVRFAGGRTFTVSETDDIDYWLDTYEKGQNTYVILSLLYPNLKLSQVSFHQDHCHPYVSFDSKKLATFNLAEEQVREWQRKRNLLPNLQFLEGAENESKNKTPLKEWVETGHDFKYHPKDISLELQDFEEFFTARRQLMKEELKRIFDISVKQNPNNTE